MNFTSYEYFVKNARKTEIKTHNVDMAMTRGHAVQDHDIVRESLVILRRFAKMVKERQQIRFEKADLAMDLATAFSVNYNIADEVPEELLTRIAKARNLDFQAFKASWKQLHIEKEVEIKSRLCEGMLDGAKRANVDESDCWATVLTRLESQPQELKRCLPAADVLETTLILSPTNAASPRLAAGYVMESRIGYSHSQSQLGSFG